MKTQSEQREIDREREREREGEREREEETEKRKRKKQKNRLKERKKIEGWKKWINVLPTPTYSKKSNKTLFSCHYFLNSSMTKWTLNNLSVDTDKNRN